MEGKGKCFLLLPIFLCTFGCFSTKVFVDPTFGKAKYTDIIQRSEPFKWKLITEFQRNGVHLPAADSELRGHVERILKGSGMAVPITGPGDTIFKVIVNNTSDTSGLSYATGFTFGIVGGH